MKSFALAAVAIFASTTTAFLGPSCAWNNCMNNWQRGDCASNSHWDCLCGNSTAIAELNSCVASSCSNTTDQDAIYAAVAQLCVNNGHTITNSPEATFSATSGGTLSAIATGRPYGPPGGWSSGDWSSWLSSCSTAIGWGWGGVGPTGRFPGPFCSPSGGWPSSWGPWTGWTSGWTWTQCTGTGTAITTTVVPTTMTMTVTSNGVASVMTTATSFAVQAQVQAASVTSTTSGNLAAPTSNAYLAMFGGAAAAAFGLMVAL